MLVMVPCLTIWADFMGVMGGMRLRRGRRQFHVHLVFSGDARCPGAARYLHRPDQERAVCAGDYGGRLPGGLLDRSGRRGGGALHDLGRGDVDLSGDRG